MQQRGFMKISMELIQALRADTGIGLSLCKKALEEAAGDIEAAKDWLKKQGHAQAAKVADRETTQGLVAFASTETFGSLVVLSCETDFVSGNDQFGKFANALAKVAAKNGATTLEALNACAMDDGTVVSQGLVELISSIKENIVIKEVLSLKAEADEKILGYVYRTKVNEVPDIGSRACMIVYKGSDADAVKNIGMHVVANNTQYLISDDIPVSFIEKEKELFRERMLVEGKPANMIDKIIEGKVGQMYKEHALMHQLYFKDPSMTIGEYVAKSNLVIVKFASLKV